MLFINNLILVLTILWAGTAAAGVETANTLPVGVYSPEFNFGLISGLGQKFDNSGSLVGVADQYHMDLTGAKIAQLSGQAKTLVGALNALSPNLGNSLSMGSVDFQANPTIDYYVLNPAYGLSKNVSLGFALPFIHFQNQMQIVGSGTNNLQAVQSFSGGASADVKNALGQASAMALNMPATVQSALIAKGYKPLGNEDITGIGDALIYARFRYFENEKWRLAVRPYLLLPTGRPDDPDDLADIAMGGYLGAGGYLTQEYFIMPRWIGSIIFQYEAHLPTTIKKRVPYNQDDILPGSDQKQGVNWNPGNIYDVMLANRYQVLRFLTVGTFYELTFKDPDWFDGNQDGYDYAFLGHDTGYAIQRLGAYVEFSTIDFYFENRFALPFSFGYTFTNSVSAVNSPQSTSHLVNLRMFF